MRFNNSILRSCFFIDIQPISDNKMKNIKFKTVFICKVNSFLFACDYKNKKIAQQNDVVSNALCKATAHRF